MSDPTDPDDLSAPASLGDPFERLLAAAPDDVRPPLLAGTQVAGRYEVVRAIGAGAMGTVYLARDRDLEREVALKLHRTGAGTEQMRREAVAMAKLAHPNVVAVFEVGEHEGRTFVAMEYVPGTTLRGWLAEHRADRAATLAVMLAAGDGLAAAHAAGLVHRDFKPENVLIGRDARPRVSDFGLALGDDATADPMAIVGTPAYMAPEQAAGRGVDARADQYAFCAVAWEAVFGERPFGGARAPGTTRLRRVLERGLERDPARRYPTLRDALADLRRATRRSPARALAIGAGVLAVGGALAVALWPAPVDPAAACAGAGDDLLALEKARGAALRALGGPGETAALHLGEFVAAYRAASVEVCRAEASRRWSTELASRGRACLALRRALGERLIPAPVAPGATTGDDYVARTLGLPDPNACRDAKLLSSQLPLPDDPVRATAIVDARAALDAAVLARQPERTRALERAIAAVEASPARAEPLIAPRLRYAHGKLALASEDYAAAATWMSEAYYAARAIDDVDTLLEAVAQLIVDAGSRRDLPGAEVWRQTGLADAERERGRSPRAAAGLYIAVATVGQLHSDPTPGLRYLDQALPLLGDAPSIQLVDALMIRASLRVSQGDAAGVVADYRRVAELSPVLWGPDHLAVASLAGEAAAGMLAVQRAADARELIAVAEGVFARNPNRPSSLAYGTTLLNIGAVKLESGDPAGARRVLDQARLRIAAVLGEDHGDVALVDINLAECMTKLGELDAGIALFRAVLARHEKLPHPHEDRAVTQVGLATALRDRGTPRDRVEALAIAIAATTEFAEGDSRRLYAYEVAGTVALALGRTQRARELAAEALALPAAATAGAALRANLLVVRGRATGDREDLATARQMFVELGDAARAAQIDGFARALAER